jgi:hypothetical protein
VGEAGELPGDTCEAALKRAIGRMLGVLEQRYAPQMTRLRLLPLLPSVLALLALAPASRADSSSSAGLFVGPRLGAVDPFGGDIAKATGPGVSVGAELGFRFQRHLFLAVIADHAFLSAVPGDTIPSPSASASGNSVDAVFGVITNPGRVSGRFELGGGYRVVVTETWTASAFASAYTGAECLLGAGLELPIGPFVRVVPGFNLAVGSMTGDQRSSLYTIGTLGLSGDFNLDFR